MLGCGEQLPLKLHTHLPCVRCHPSPWPAAHVLFFDLDGKMDIIRLLEVGSIAVGRAAEACNRSQMMMWWRGRISGVCMLPYAKALLLYHTAWCICVARTPMQHRRCWMRASGCGRRRQGCRRSSRMSSRPCRTA